MNPRYQICTRCLMDTSDPDITFDQNGVCGHCRHYDHRAASELHHGPAGQQRLERLIREVKERGRGQKYDCVIGLSGGVDSSMVVYMVNKLGLRPLAVHVDNGWNSDLARGNIEKLATKLEIELLTYVIDWEEVKDLHLSFLKASVANSEIPTDHAIVAGLYRTAVRQGIRHIFSGSNIATEAIMPDSWGYDAKDFRHLKAIHRKFGRVKLKTFPTLTLLDWVYCTFVKRITFIPILNYFPYNREEAMNLLERELGWQRYPAKHFESVYTRFFQAYILPVKFGIDKRRAHLSNLVCSGQMTRAEALREMEKPPYPSEILLQQDRDYILEKLGLNRAEFDRIMSAPPKSFREYPNNLFWFEKLGFIVRLAKKMATYN